MFLVFSLILLQIRELHIAFSFFFSLSLSSCLHSLLPLLTSLNSTHLCHAVVNYLLLTLDSECLELD